MADQHIDRAARIWREPQVEQGALHPDAFRPPRVIVTPLRPPLIHPLTKRDVQLALSVLPPASTAGLRSVSLLGERLLPGGVPVFASYRHRGFLRLHAVSSLPWTLAAPDPALLEDLRQFDALIETRVDGSARVSWPGDSLRMFYLLSVLLPGVARHRRERDGSPETDGNVRWLAHGDEPWWVSAEALRQWQDLLRRAGGW